MQQELIEYSHKCMQAHGYGGRRRGRGNCSRSITCVKCTKMYRFNFLGRGIVNLLPKISSRVHGPRTFQNVDTPVGVSTESALPEIWLPPIGTVRRLHACNAYMSNKFIVIIYLMSLYRATMWHNQAHK